MTHDCEWDRHHKRAEPSDVGQHLGQMKMVVYSFEIRFLVIILGCIVSRDSKRKFSDDIARSSLLMRCLRGTYPKTWHTLANVVRSLPDHFE